MIRERQPRLRPVWSRTVKAHGTLTTQMVSVKSIAVPIRFAENGPTYRRYPPRLGEHNDEIRALSATW